MNLQMCHDVKILMMMGGDSSSVVDCDIVETLVPDYVKFRTKTLGKSMNPLILQLLVK